MTQWQPIDSVPEGKNVLLFWPIGQKGNGGMECAVVYRDETEKSGFSYWTHGGANAGWDFQDPCNGEKPTHWMPLPAPPLGEPA